MDGIIVDSGRCEWCDGDAIAKFPLMRKVVGGRRAAKVTTNRWVYSCGNCIDKASNYAASGLIRPKGVR